MIRKIFDLHSINSMQTGINIMLKLTKQEELERLKKKYDELIKKNDIAGAAACIAQMSAVRAIPESTKRERIESKK